MAETHLEILAESKLETLKKQIASDEKEKMDAKFAKYVAKSMKGLDLPQLKKKFDAAEDDDEREIIKKEMEDMKEASRKSNLDRDDASDDEDAEEDRDDANVDDDDAEEDKDMKGKKGKKARKAYEDERKEAKKTARLLKKAVARIQALEHDYDLLKSSTPEAQSKLSVIESHLVSRGLDANQVSKQMASIKDGGAKRIDESFNLVSPVEVGTSADFAGMLANKATASISYDKQGFVPVELTS